MYLASDLSSMSGMSVRHIYGLAKKGSLPSFLDANGNRQFPEQALMLLISRDEECTLVISEETQIHNLSSTVRSEIRGFAAMSSDVFAGVPSDEEEAAIEILAEMPGLVKVIVASPRVDADRFLQKLMIPLIKSGVSILVLTGLCRIGEPLEQHRVDRLSEKRGMAEP